MNSGRPQVVRRSEEVSRGAPRRALAARSPAAMVLDSGWGPPGGCPRPLVRRGMTPGAQPTKLSRPQGLTLNPYVSASPIATSPVLSFFSQVIVLPEIATTMVSGISRSPRPSGTDLAYTARRPPTGFRSPPLYLLARDQRQAAQVPPRDFARQGPPGCHLYASFAVLLMSPSSPAHRAPPSSPILNPCRPTAVHDDAR